MCFKFNYHSANNNNYHSSEEGGQKPLKIKTYSIQSSSNTCENYLLKSTQSTETSWMLFKTSNCDYGKFSKWPHDEIPKHSQEI